MKQIFNVFVLCFSVLLFISLQHSNAQTFDGDWIVEYATADNTTNGTSETTPSVAVVSENEFVALVLSDDTTACHLVGYRDADSLNGRLGVYQYGGSDVLKQTWAKGFTNIQMDMAKDIANDGSIIYVANNDEDHNILTFELGEDSVYSHDYRLTTGEESIWAIDLDDNGYVYVTTEADSASNAKVMVFEGPDLNDEWSGNNPSLEPVTEFTLPDIGSARGLSVTNDGTILYVSNYHARKVYCYSGSPTGGYEQYDGFSFEMTGEFETEGGTVYEPAPFGVTLMEGKNILFVSADFNDDLLAGGYNGDHTEFGEIYAVNPNTGEILDTIDVVAWNLAVGGSLTNTSPGTCAGYATPYATDYDENNNLYNVCFWGWSVEKRSFTGDLPEIELTLTGVEKDLTAIPDEFKLRQNYPNPFNPKTTIEFALSEGADINLDVYSITGEHIESLISSTYFKAGTYKLTFNADNLASGTYIYTIDNGNTKISKKMVLLK